MSEIIRFLFKGEVSQENFGIIGNIKFIATTYLKILLFYIVVVVIFAVLGFMKSDASPSIKNDNIPQYFTLLFVCIIAPIIEELIFRLPLKTNKINLLVAIFCLNVFIFFITKKHFKGLTENYILNLIYFISLVVSMMFTYVKNHELINFIENNFILFLHTSAVVFCLFHIKNYNFNIDSILPYLLMFLVLFIGYFFSYITLRFGIKYSIAMHVFHNTLISLPMIIKLLK